MGSNKGNEVEPKEITSLEQIIDNKWKSNSKSSWKTMVKEFSKCLLNKCN